MMLLLFTGLSGPDSIFTDRWDIADWGVEQTSLILVKGVTEDVHTVGYTNPRDILGGILPGVRILGLSRRMLG